MQPTEGFTWRYSNADDAEAMTAIYNESVAGGGHSPALRPASAQAMRQMVRECRRKGWPTWIMQHGAEAVAWAQVRPIAWGPEVCHRTGDVSLYVRRDWQGRGLPMHIVRHIYAEAQRHGFDALSCWILGSNRKSRMVARAFRLQLWGCLPGAAHYGDRTDDVLIYGVQLDDEPWRSFMAKRIARQLRRQAGAGA